MSCRTPRTEEEYLKAQDLLLDEALEGDYTQIPINSKVCSDLWFFDNAHKRAYRTVGLLHRWLFFSDYLKPGIDPFDRVFSIYTFSALFQKAVYTRGIAHPKRDLIDFVKEALHKMEDAGIVEFVIKDNGYLGVCLCTNRKRTVEITAGKARYAKDKEQRQQQHSKNLKLLSRCFELPTTK